jgi:hypothetical protein
MDTTFEQARSAGRIVRRAWTRRQWQSPEGAVCMVQAVINAADGRYSRDRIETELDRQLQSSRSYRAIQRIGKKVGWDRQTCLIRWNDMPWRRQYEVVAALDGTADHMEAEARAKEMKRLQREIDKYEKHIRLLVDYIAELEAEIPWLWGRRKKARTIRKRREDLAAQREKLEANGLLLEQLRTAA